MLRTSVIIPTYNRADYLPLALESVLTQSLRPFEVIVVDDGSSDDTATLVRAYEPDVRYFWQDHKGVSAARNLGLDVARGDVIAWLDADDLWESTFLASTVSLLAADGDLDGVYTGCAYINAGGNLLPQSDCGAVEPSELFSSLIERCFIATPAIVVRKECYDQVGRFDPQLSIGEDYDMWLRLARFFTIAGLPTPLIKVRVHDSNTIRNTAAFSRFYLALVEKHFGLPEGNPSTWSEEKRRAYACAFRTLALRHMQDGQLDEGWQSLSKAVCAWPALLNQLTTYYELAFGDRPRGYRNQAPLSEIEVNGSKMLEWLDDLYEREPAFEPMRRAAYGNAYLSLGMLGDQAGEWGAARRYLLQAIKINPRLLGSYPVVRRLLKLCAGKSLVDVLGRYLGERR